VTGHDDAVERELVEEREQVVLVVDIAVRLPMRAQAVAAKVDGDDA
jgi:hypothetical protein